MAKSKTDLLSKELEANFAKAWRRAKKLERTLLRLVAQREPGSPIDDLLHAVQYGIDLLRKEVEAFNPMSGKKNKRISGKKRSNSASHRSSLPGSKVKVTSRGRASGRAAI